MSDPSQVAVESWQREEGAGELRKALLDWLLVLTGRDVGTTYADRAWLAVEVDDLLAGPLADLVCQRDEAQAKLRELEKQPTCGDLSPGINFGGDGDARRLMCTLPFGHGGAHQCEGSMGYAPTRWVDRGDDR